MYSDDLATAYDLTFVNKDYDGEAAFIADLIRERNPGAASVLDVACGTGRHLLALSARFPDAAGVDLSPSMAALARERVPGEVPVVVGDMREFELGRRFDAVTCMFGSVGYVCEPTELDRAIARMAAHLEPGGTLILEPWHSPDSFKHGTKATVAAKDGDRALTTLIVNIRNGSRGIMDMHHTIADGLEVRSAHDVHELGLFTDAVYRASFEAAGMSVTHRDDAPGRGGLYVGVVR